MSTYTRKIYLNERDFSAEITTCSFNWVQDGGCDKAQLTIQSAEFDDFRDLDTGQDVDIRFSDSVNDRWWRGVISELKSSLAGGLSIDCDGSRTLLAQLYPIGRFGAAINTTAPSNITVSGAATGGELPTNTTYKYWVSALDEVGETLATLCATTVTFTGGSSTGVVTVSWDACENAVAYRVYRSPNTANPTRYYETSYTTLEDDDTLSYVSVSAVPSVSTANTATIASAKVNDVVSYLLTTYLPTGFTAGSITAGTATDLDDYDLTAGSSPLLEVLDTLADIVGDTIWGVDVDNTVFFIPKETVTATWTLRQYSGPAKPTEYNLLLNASRGKSRDGITAVQVEGEEKMNNLRYQTKGIGSITLTSNNGYYDNLFSRPTISGLVLHNADFPNLVCTAAFVRSYATWAAWVADFPTLRFVWPLVCGNGVSAPLWSDEYTAWYLSHVSAMGNIPLGSAYCMKRFPGIRTPDLAVRAAAGRAAKYKQDPETWELVLGRVNTLFRPGLGLIKFTTDAGTTYGLEVQSASYVFGESVSASINAGDRQYEPQEEKRDQVKVLRQLSARTVYDNRWMPHA